MDTEWAIDELGVFLKLTELYRPPDPPGMVIFSSSLSNRGKEEDIVASAQVVEQILDRVLPRWRTEVEGDTSNRWTKHMEASRRAIVVIRRQAEIDDKLGDSAPRLSASHVHPWVWEAAAASWNAGFHTHAVTDALMRVNLETQRKTGRVQSEIDLFTQVFSGNAAKPNEPRLRLVDDRNPKTYSSVHRGATAYAEGLYAAVRNPLSHSQGNLPEDEALELLAAISVLARWVDRATLETAP